MVTARVKTVETASRASSVTRTAILAVSISFQAGLSSCFAVSDLNV